MNEKELWSALSGKLKAIVDDNSYSIWIAPIKPVELTREKLILSVDNDFTQTWIHENYLPLMSQVLSAVFPNEKREIVLQVQKSADNPLPPPAPPKPVQRQANVAKKAASKCIGTLNENFTFDEFVVGPSNSWAHAAALAVAKKPGTAYNPLFIYGDTGIGKTHLMQAVGHKILEQPGKVVAYISTETLLNEYVNSIQTHSDSDFRNKYRSVDVLLIDDVQFMASKSGIQEEFFNTFNALYTAKKQIIITSDRPASEISGLEQRLVSRFNAGMATQIECPNFETRLAILRYKQSSVEKPLSDEIQTFIAENVKSNVRALEGAMNRAMALRDFNTDEPLTIEKLRYVLRDLLEKEKEGDITLDEIQKTVSEFFNIKRTDLLSTDRMRSVAIPRQIAMYLSRRLTHASLLDIGSAFEKTHGTVVHACKQIQGSLKIDSDLRANVRSIVKKLGQDADALGI
jgi:chromosomal replication initiator protein